MADRWALISDGTVVNVVLSVDDPSVRYPDYTVLPANGAGPGDTWDGETFTPAPTEAAITETQRLTALRALVRIDLDDKIRGDLVEDPSPFAALYDLWVAGEAVEVGDLRAFDHPDHGLVVVECIQAHTTQDDWTPDVTPALWKIHRVTSGDQPDEWVQPTGAHDAYNTGDRVTFEGQVYESLIDGNVWSPAESPSSWQLIS
jgi:hypothetical protein